MPDPDISACIPAIHLNGTSRAELLRAHTDALDLLRVACEQLCRCGPNGRDFYPKGQDAITAATTACSAWARSCVRSS